MMVTTTGGCKLWGVGSMPGSGEAGQPSTKMGSGHGANCLSVSDGEWGAGRS